MMLPAVLPLQESKSLMNKFVIATYRKGLLTFQSFCPVGVHFAQTASSVCPLSSSGQEKGCFGSWGCFVFIHSSKRGLLQLSKEQGLVVVFWSK